MVLDERPRQRRKEIELMTCRDEVQDRSQAILRTMVDVVTKAIEVCKYLRPCI
jgi:hypothetical protein